MNELLPSRVADMTQVGHELQNRAEGLSISEHDRFDLDLLVVIISIL